MKQLPNVGSKRYITPLRIRLLRRERDNKADGLPYTVYTPYKNKWLRELQKNAPVKNMTDCLLY
jgi:deoxyribodipyrimidine photolyase